MSDPRRSPCAEWLGELLRTEPEEARSVIEKQLETYGGNVSKAARNLGVSRPFFWKCLRALNMRRRPAQLRDRWRERLRITGPAASGRTET